MIQTQTLMVPTMFDESIAPKIGGEAINSVARKAKHALDTALVSGWRIVHCNPIVYMNVVYIHYVLEHQIEDAEDREHLIEEVAAYLRSKK